MLYLILATALAGETASPDATLVCPVYVPAGLPGQYTWIPASVGGEEADKAALSAQAQENAKAALVAQYSEGVTPLVVENIRREVHTKDLGWVKGKGRSGVACGVAFITTAYANELHQDDDRVTTELARAASEVTAALKTGDQCPEVAGRALFLPPVVTVDGYVAGSMGATLSSRLKASLAAERTRIASTDDPTAARLGVELNPHDAKGVGVTLTLYPPGSTTSCGIATGFAVNPRVLVADVDAAMAELRGIAAGSWGTDRWGRRMGAGGLTVTAALDDPDANLCEGQRPTLTFTTNQPAQVQVYDLGPDGRGWKVHPSASGAFLSTLANTAVGVPFDAAPFPTPGNEHFLVVALPQGADSGILGSYRGYCTLDHPLTAADVPVTAALQLVRFRVDRAGSSVCPNAQAVTASGGDPPVCGSR